MDNIPSVWIWLAVAVACGLIEAATAGLATIWFAIGALLSMIVGFMGGGIGLQVAVFLISSLALLIFTRPIAVKYLKVGTEKTNADRLIGEIGLVTESIDNIEGRGRVKVLGQSWAAVAQDDQHIPLDTEVEIVEINGVKLTVKQH